MKFTKKLIVVLLILTFGACNIANDAAAVKESFSLSIDGVPYSKDDLYASDDGNLYISMTDFQASPDYSVVLSYFNFDGTGTYTDDGSSSTSALTYQSSGKIYRSEDNGSDVFTEITNYQPGKSISGTFTGTAVEIGTNETIFITGSFTARL